MHNGFLTLEWHDNTTCIWLDIDVWHQLQIYGRLAQVLQLFACRNLHSHLNVVTLNNLTSLGIYPRSCASVHKRLFNSRYRGLLLKECTRLLLALPPPMVFPTYGKSTRGPFSLVTCSTLVSWIPGYACLLSCVLVWALLQSPQSTTPFGIGPVSWLYL